VNATPSAEQALSRPQATPASVRREPKSCQASPKQHTPALEYVRQELAPAPCRAHGVAPALVILLLLSTCLAHAESAWQSVWNSEAALRRTSFQGQARTQALIEGHERNATAAVRAANGQIRLDYQAGERRWSVIDDGRRLIRLQPSKRSALALPRPRLAIDQTLAERNYAVRVAGEAQIAGRPTREFEIAPRSRGPVAWRLWLDRDNDFPLKRERYNVEGRLISGTEFTSLESGVQVPSDIFAIPAGWKIVEEDGGEKSYSVSELTRQLGFEVVVPRYLPPGYLLQGGYIQVRGRRRHTVAELRYTDGLRLLSVNQRPVGREEAGAGHGRGRERGGRSRGRGGRREGEEGGFGFGPSREPMTVVERDSEKALRYRGKNRVVVVVGDLTKDQLVRVASSLD